MPLSTGTVLTNIDRAPFPNPDAEAVFARLEASQPLQSQVEKIASSPNPFARIASRPTPSLSFTAQRPTSTPFSFISFLNQRPASAPGPPIASGPLIFSDRAASASSFTFSTGPRPPTALPSTSADVNNGSSTATETSFGANTYVI